VAIITGASQGIGAGLVDGLRRSPALDMERVDSTRQVFVLTHADRYVLSMGDFIARTQKRVVN
jgi:NAD(P)-dependent dehydrogenase (short-subunit alcohol dehydrogenase family)